MKILYQTIIQLAILVINSFGQIQSKIETNMKPYLTQNSEKIIQTTTQAIKNSNKFQIVHLLQVLRNSDGYQLRISENQKVLSKLNNNYEWTEKIFFLSAKSISNNIEFDHIIKTNMLYLHKQKKQDDLTVHNTSQYLIGVQEKFNSTHLQDFQSFIFKILIDYDYDHFEGKENYSTDISDTLEKVEIDFTLFQQYDSSSTKMDLFDQITPRLSFFNYFFKVDQIYSPLMQNSDSIYAINNYLLQEINNDSQNYSDKDNHLFVHDYLIIITYDLLFDTIQKFHIAVNGQNLNQEILDLMQNKYKGDSRAPITQISNVLLIAHPCFDQTLLDSVIASFSKNKCIKPYQIKYDTSAESFIIKTIAEQSTLTQFEIAQNDLDHSFLDEYNGIHSMLLYIHDNNVFLFLGFDMFQKTLPLTHSSFIVESYDYGPPATFSSEPYNFKTAFDIIIKDTVQDEQSSIAVHNSSVSGIITTVRILSTLDLLIFATTEGRVQFYSKVPNDDVCDSEPYQLSGFEFAPTYFDSHYDIVLTINIFDEWNFVYQVEMQNMNSVVLNKFNLIRAPIIVQTYKKLLIDLTPKQNFFKQLFSGFLNYRGNQINDFSFDRFSNSILVSYSDELRNQKLDDIILGKDRQTLVQKNSEIACVNYQRENGSFIFLGGFTKNPNPTAFQNVGTVDDPEYSTKQVIFLNNPILKVIQCDLSTEYNNPNQVVYASWDGTVFLISKSEFNLKVLELYQNDDRSVDFLNSIATQTIKFNTGINAVDVVSDGTDVAVLVGYLTGELEVQDPISRTSDTYSICNDGISSFVSMKSDTNLGFGGAGGIQNDNIYGVLISCQSGGSQVFNQFSKSKRSAEKFGKDSQEGNSLHETIENILESNVINFATGTLYSIPFSTTNNPFNQQIVTGWDQGWISLIANGSYTSQVAQAKISEVDITRVKFIWDEDYKQLKNNQLGVQKSFMLASDRLSRLWVVRFIDIKVLQINAQINAEIIPQCKDATKICVMNKQEQNPQLKDNLKSDNIIIYNWQENSLIVMTGNDNQSEVCNITFSPVKKNFNLFPLGKIFPPVRKQFGYNMFHLYDESGIQTKTQLVTIAYYDDPVYSIVLILTDLSDVEKFQDTILNNGALQDDSIFYTTILGLFYKIIVFDNILTPGIVTFLEFGKVHILMDQDQTQLPTVKHYFQNIYYQNFFKSFEFELIQSQSDIQGFFFQQGSHCRKQSAEFYLQNDLSNDSSQTLEVDNRLTNEDGDFIIAFDVSEQKDVSDSTDIQVYFLIKGAVQQQDTKFQWLIYDRTCDRIKQQQLDNIMLAHIQDNCLMYQVEDVNGTFKLNFDQFSTTSCGSDTDTYAARVYELGSELINQGKSIIHIQDLLQIKVNDEIQLILYLAFTDEFLQYLVADITVGNQERNAFNLLIGTSASKLKIVDSDGLRVQVSSITGMKGFDISQILENTKQVIDYEFENVETQNRFQGEF